MNLLTTQNLRLQRGNRLLLDKLNLQIAAGQCWAVMGRNGSGKSSLLKALAGLDEHSRDAVILNSTPLHVLKPRERARRIGLVFQHSDSGFHSTALEMALSGHYPHQNNWGWSCREGHELANLALEAVGLHGMAGRPLESLSGGELRRAEIARLLVQRPRLAMLDEPLNHLDIGQQIAMLGVLCRQFRQKGHALLMVLHDINLARQVATHLLLLYGDGRWLAGPVEETGTRERLGEVLGYPLNESDTPQGPLLTPDFYSTALGVAGGTPCQQDK